MTRRIAVYGGSFNPFGNNHLDVVRYVAESGEFDAVILVPSIAHALKTSQFPYEHRYNMAELGIKARYHAVPSFPERVSISVSMAELHMLKTQPGPIYTWNLLKYLQKEQAQISTDVEYRFVIGPDIFDEIDQWKYVDEIRRDFGFFEAPDVGLHMTQVRDMIANGVSTWHQHVPHQVAHYIKLHGLYHVDRVECDHDFDELSYPAQDNLDRSRIAKGKPLLPRTITEVCDKCGLERTHLHRLPKATAERST